jgi:lysozyme
MMSNKKKKKLMTNRVPKSGLELIKQFEGCELTAYPDPASGGVPWTIGWGSTYDEKGAPFKEGDKITLQRAESLLVDTLNKIYLPAIEKIPYFVEMSEEQKGALLSFAYNLGASFYGNPDFTTISRYLRTKDWERVPSALLLYRNPGSSVEEGLRRRREAEGKLWSSGLDTFKHSKRLIVAKEDTILKKEPLQSFELSETSKVVVPKGRSYTAINTVDEGSHIKVTLDSGAGTWYIYKPHWDIKVPGQMETNGQVIKLDCPYYTQLDSTTNQGARMCFSSTCAMAAEFLKPGCLGGNRGADDRYLTKYVFKYGDTTSNVAQTRALSELGIVAVFRNNLSRQDVVDRLSEGIPVPVGYLHKGPISSPSGGGHWSLIVGIDLENSQYIVHDPWGECDLVGGGMMGSQNGAFLRYSFKNFERRWMVEGNRTGWGLILVKP